MRNQSYEIIERLPTAEEHLTLWESVGWGTVDREMAEQSLARSIYGVIVLFGGDVVGMGRIVGDGAMYFYIQDVAVLPEHQKRGIGDMIVRRLLDFITSNKRNDGNAFVGLFASRGNDTFYERFGFQDHSLDMTGMFKVLEP
ncbi:GNAT family N-acetyltransferase [Paenibacillus thailandensis]|uniref:GNAT family N-acetyltransferase n=1 Tax=Paenibacillus thailandensis TaxID=393250 RepID=A0ABW5QRL5_9BACL